MTALLYAIDTDGCRADLQSLIGYARTALPDVAIKGVWIDQTSDASMRQRPGGAALLNKVKRGDHVVLPSLETVGFAIADLKETIRILVNHRRLTLHFVAEDFVYGPGGDAERLNALAEQSHRRWWERRVRVGWNAWKARPGKVTRWPPYGTHVVVRNGKRIVEACWWERKWIALAVELHRSGKSIPAITAELKRRKAKTSSGHEWSEVRVRRAVKARLAEEARVGKPAVGAELATISKTELSQSAPTVKLITKRTSKRPETFEVAGITVKRYPKSAPTAADTSREARELLAVVRMIVGPPRRKWSLRRRWNFSW